MQVLVPRRVAGAAGRRPCAGRASASARRPSSELDALPGDRAGHRAEDRRLPAGARRLPLGRRPRCDSRHRPRAHRAAAGARVAVIERALADRCSCSPRASGWRWRTPRALPPSCSASSSSPRRRGAVVRVRGCRPARWRSCSRAGGSARARLGALDRSLLEPELGRSAAVTAVVTGPVRKTPFALRVPAEVRRFGARSLSERVLLELPVGRSPPQGAILAFRAPDRGSSRARGRLRRARLAGAPRRPRRAPRRRLADRRPARRASAASPIGSARTSRARSPLGSKGSGARVLAGIVLGEDEGLSDELRDSFKASGLYHLLAVSGQNITFLALGVLGLAWLLGIPRLAAEVVAIAGDRRLRARRRLAALRRPGRCRGRARLARVAPVAAARPLALPRARRGGPARLDPGEPARARLPALVRRRRIDLPAAAEAAARARGLPADRAGCATRSRSRPPAERQRRRSCGSSSGPSRSTRCSRTCSSRSRSARCSASRSSGSLIQPLLPSAALALAFLNGWVAAYIAACARLVGGLPFAQIGSGTAVCVLLGTPLALLALQRLPRWRRPAALACAATVVPALLVWQLFPAAKLPPPTGLRITFLDVGQGDAILLQVPEGAILVDQGPPEAKVAQQLRGLGVRRLAAVVLTHPQRDHIGGAETVIRRLGVDRVLDPRLAASEPVRAGGARRRRGARRRGRRDACR